MNLYTFLLIFNLILKVFSKNIIIVTGVNEPETKSVGLQFVTKITNIKDADCAVDIYPDECCIENDNKCDIVQIMGETNDVIDKRASKTYIMVAPLLNPYDRKGYCRLYIDSRPTTNPKNVIRDTVKINFYTKLKRATIFNELKRCQHFDEDLLNNCKPVNCETYYNGKKPYFQVTKQKCVAVPKCVSKHIAINKIPTSAYNPISNKCIGKRNVGKEDIRYIKEITEDSKENIEVSNKTEYRKNKINEVNGAPVTKGPCIKPKTTTEKSHKNKLIEKIQKIKTALSRNKDKCKKVEQCKSVKQSKKLEQSKNVKRNKKVEQIKEIKQNKKVEQSKNVKQNKKVEQSKNQEPNKCFTSKINEIDEALKMEKLENKCKACDMGSIIDQKLKTTLLSSVIFIQCCIISTVLYCLCKTCDCKKKKKIVKQIFNYRQDDSLTTPLIGNSNADTGTTEYQYISETSNYIDKKIKCYKACQKERKNNMKLSMSDDILSKCITRRDWLRCPRSQTIPEAKTHDETKIKEQGSRPDKIAVPKESSLHEYENKPSKSIIKIQNTSKTVAAMRSDSTEREICCHSYHYDENESNSFLNNNSKSKSFGIHSREDQKAESIEKSAQAYFSNDSVDDFLSEGGVLFIGDNVSKYSYSSLSGKCSTSSQSSKTSKNNIVNNVISLLAKKSKGPSSEPGTKKSSPDFDLKLLHLSKASFSSSVDDTDVKDIKRFKDSTSSL